MTGTYTSPERVERDGRLVAFEGETMTMDEALERGLVKAGKPRAPRGRRKADKPTDGAEVEPTGATEEE